MQTQFLATPAQAAAHAAELIARRLQRALVERGRASVALSGGNSPVPMLTALAQQDLDWSRVDVFQVDERVAPRGDSARNLTVLEDLLVVRGPVARQRLHPMWVDRANLDQAAAEYERELTTIAGEPPVLDVVHLGLGGDGHTASLFPGDAVLQVTDRNVALTDTHNGHRRMTLTLPMLNRAGRIVWYVTGADKADVLADLVAGGAPMPSARVARRRAVVVADVTAASAIAARSR